MPEPGSVAAVVVLAAASTWGLRAARRAGADARERRRRPPGPAHALGVMVVLAVHTLRDVPTDSAPAALPFVAAVTVTVGLHLWRHDALLSILAGTAVHVALATVLAGG